MKRIAGVLIILFFSALLLVFSAEVKTAALDALRLWSSQLVPLLFPFFICADLLRRLQGGSLSAPILFFMSMIGGAPAGARLSAAYVSDIKRRTDAAAALNMISPMYVFGAYCCDMLASPLLALPILLSQYISAALFFLFSVRRAPAPLMQPTETFEPLTALSACVCDAVRAILSVGGTIVGFKVALSILSRLYSLLSLPAVPALPAALIVGLAEFVNGCALLAECKLSAPAAAAASAFVFSFGGLCVLSQSACFVQLLPGRYILRKLLQGLLAAPLAYGLCLLTCGGAADVFLHVNAEAVKENAFSAFGMLLVASLSLSFLWLLQYALQKKKAARK